MQKKALAIIERSCKEFQPIHFTKVTPKIFVNFLSSMARTNTDGNKTLSKSGCGSYRSALKDLYRQCQVQVPPVFEAELTTLFKGLLRAHAQEKEKNGSRLAEGKDPMPFALYKILCKKMMADPTKEAIFAHAFLTLTWNLICRSKNTVYIHRNHIYWDHDLLVIMFAHMKTSMEGSDSQQKRHVYANPKNISICAVTALAKYLITFPAKADGMLFDKNSYNRFGTHLRKVVKENKDEVERLGIKLEDIGVHSIRKGAAKYCCSGTTAAPHIAAVCICAGWTMGRVKDTYIQYAAAGDQHVGRVIAGLPVLSKDYACSPPYFRIDDTDPAASNTCTSDDVNEILQHFFLFEISVQFKPVAIAAVAALMYARDELNNKQPEFRLVL